MGLYDDEGPITTGPLVDSDYQQSAESFEQLEDALNRRQPEYVIWRILDKVKYRFLNITVPKFPEHEDVKKWKALAEKLESKINKNAAKAEATTAFQADWDNSLGSDLRRWYREAKAQANQGLWSDAGKTADRYVYKYKSVSDPGEKNTFTEWYAAFSAEWKKKFETWAGEMTALIAEAKTK
jgi:hypothetical protein